jgi:hypothetical protein
MEEEFAGVDSIRLERRFARNVESRAVVKQGSGRKPG